MGGGGVGRNAVLAFGIDISELGSIWTEMCAEGTGAEVSGL